MRIVMVARIPSAGVATFQLFERGVLPLMSDHGGRLERRLRSTGGRAEIHIVRFSSRAGFDAYRADPRRVDHLRLLEESGANQEVFEAEDVELD